MFTGLVEAVAPVTSSDAGSIRVDLSLLDEPPRRGDSVSINGVCLTVADAASGNCTFDVSDETVSRTTLGRIRVRELVNVERALRMSDRIGGHFVTGHVDGVGLVESISPERLDVSLPAQLLRAVVPKGSIAVDGISLTIARLEGNGFSAALIPHTFSKTCLHLKKRGSSLNIETDIIGKYVNRLMNPAGEGVTLEALRRHGFTDRTALEE